ncbi:MAG: hypothetical protein WDA16_03720 [Candidatus Thermoplasmatota archaeon]
MNWIAWAALGSVAALAAAVAVGAMVAKGNECDVTVQFERLSTAVPGAVNLTDEFINGLPSEVVKAFRTAEQHAQGNASIKSVELASLRALFKTVDPRETGSFLYNSRGFQLTYETC